MKGLIIGNGKFTKGDLISPAQIYPFFNHKQQLQRELGLEIKHIQATTFLEIEKACLNASDIDVFFIRPDWNESPLEGERVLQAIRQKFPHQKIIFIDPWDQITSSFFNLLPYVDWFLKYQCLKDVNQYRQPLAGGTVITDYLVKELGYDLHGWRIGSVIPAGYEHRILPAWNVTLIERFQKPLFSRPLLPWFKPQKDIDLFCRVSYGVRGSTDWYGRYRMAAIEAIKPLEADCQLAVSGEYIGERAVPSRRYFDEIKRSRIVFSPFGWGETTWRDYEAVVYNCLLIKPAMHHLATEPNIYIPGETYVPIKWDFSDLEATCRYYLQHPEEANRIIANARRVYQSYFKEGKFVQQIKHLIQTDAPVPTGDATASQPYSVYKMPKSVGQ